MVIIHLDFLHCFSKGYLVRWWCVFASLCSFPLPAFFYLSQYASSTGLPSAATHWGLDMTCIRWSGLKNEMSSSVFLAPQKPPFWIFVQTLEKRRKPPLSVSWISCLQPTKPRRMRTQSESHYIKKLMWLFLPSQIYGERFMLATFFSW